jgi:hypothetical protein
MPGIDKVKEATLAELEKLVRDQKFCVGIKQTRDADGVVVIVFRTLPDSPEALAVELTAVPEIRKDGKVVTDRSFRICILYTEKSETHEHKDICLGLTKSEYDHFLWLCDSNPESPFLVALTKAQEQELKEISELCTRQLEAIRELSGRLGRFPLLVESLNAAKTFLDESGLKMERAREALNYTMSANEVYESNLEYHMRVVEDR